MNNNDFYTETELISLLKRKDERSFNYLYDNYSGALYNIVLKIVSDRDTANDVLQNVFLNIWRNMESYDISRGRIFTWMLHIAQNSAIDLVRSKSYQNSQKNHRMLENDYFDKKGMATHLNVDNIGLKNVIVKLKVEYRTLIELAYFKEYTHERIAKTENLPLGTVKSRLRSALLELRIYLLRYDSSEYRNYY